MTTGSGAGATVAAPKRLYGAHIADGTLEALKWIAAALMVGDHVNRFLLDSSSALLFDLGRVVMPLFGILLALNLSRPTALSSGAVDRTVGRLLVMGLIASVPYMLLGAPLAIGLPLNILFTLGLSAMTIQALRLQTRRGVWAAIVLFVIGGIAVEFWWPGVAVVVGAWVWRVGRPKVGIALFVSGMIGLCAINGNLWALLAIPVLWLATYVDVPLKRNRALFYVFYPLHLAVIYALVLLR